ncbi:MAG TPA: hypothetical protein VLB02_02835, partial [Candidatus Paceibacterota bacterium]|nr:hypothetical protein [Candidatus Paceibacterota bacterium]
MLVEQLKTRTGNQLLKVKIGGDVLVGYFTKEIKYLRPSDEKEWWHAFETWGVDIESVEVKHDPFPYLREIKGVLYAFYLKDHPKAGIVGRYLIEIKNDRETYEPINWECALDEKGGVTPFRWMRGAGENLQKSFEEIRSYGKEGEYSVDSFGIDQLGTICAWHAKCEKPNCECSSGWWEGNEKKVVLY